MTLYALSFGSLLVIFLLSVVMAISCYDDGVLGKVWLIAMALGSFVVLIDFDAYELSRATVTVELGAAGFLARHYLNFTRWRRRSRYDHITFGG